MKPGLVHSIVGLLSGFVLSMFFLALVITWPIRTLGLAIILGFAFVVIVSCDDKSPQRWRLMAGWFILGCGLASALLAVLDLVFPPLT